MNKKILTSAVIVSVYNDLQALTLILDSLLSQTTLPTEIIVAEDAQHKDIKQYLQKLNHPSIIHVSQPDNGWQKERILNTAIKISTSDYLMFIDGDCIPYNNFVQTHLRLSEERTVLCGRRSEPGAKYSALLREKKISLNTFQNRYLLNFFSMKNDHVRHYDEGICFQQNSLILSLIHKVSRKNNHIVGCHWSCFKKELELINGFDEDFTLPTTGEDTDIERRLRHFSVQMKSCRNITSVIHLYHKQNFNRSITQKTEALMRSKKEIYVCKNGLEKLY